MSKVEGSRACTVIGHVVSNKADKTIVVMVVRKKPHPLYGKYITRSTKLHAHDEENQCQMGDIVQIQETRPISKKKTWVLVNIIEQATQMSNE